MGERATRRIERAAQTRKLEDQALGLATAGYSYRQIASVQECSLGAVAKRIDRGLAAIPRVNAEAYRTLHDARIEKLWNSNYARASKGDPHALLAGVRLLDHLAKLHGLFAPQKTEHTGPGGKPLFDLSGMTYEQLAALASAGGAASESGASGGGGTRAPTPARARESARSGADAQSAVSTADAAFADRHDS